ncbi:selenium-dependent molybdenum cofactor biosynthesis protein YqeB [Thermodesulfobacteriota bacterium B35]
MPGNPAELRIILRGAGDLATGVALRLYRAGLRRMLLLEMPQPLAVRRLVSFCEAVPLGKLEVEGITACRIHSPAHWQQAVAGDKIPVLVDPGGDSINELRPDVVIDAIMAKRNLGTRITDAPLVIGLGPGFTAGRNVHCVIETMRGHTLGRVIHEGAALADTGVPGTIGGYSSERLLRSPAAGIFTTDHDIGDSVAAGDTVGRVGDRKVRARISGTLRGLLRTESPVTAGTKLGDIDPRNKPGNCTLVSDKALAIGGGVLEAILGRHTGNGR